VALVEILERDHLRRLNEISDVARHPGRECLGRLQERGAHAFELKGFRTFADAAWSLHDRAITRTWEAGIGGEIWPESGALSSCSDGSRRESDVAFREDAATGRVPRQADEAMRMQRSGRERT
jgi:hypothetical protein